ncbi:hypothetical protein A2159_01445 [Candidatus Woesebacteria bacterium RBG_13_34_9]|uniref:Tr-type G domain-containing protein n=1 Tax=Candidatus Woesebacteria bacterium RBG_13_34_9 TaxID=1802477 RepID=A0A1F7X038_9BACT|nr:MAG: hypothetical protein A2159_01445 [Candidatus Woesebacteria bacterium RBG_13_34_9]
MSIQLKNSEKLRPPIVTILGHVDHGKTTLLDFIRKTKIAQREAGGITQKIGASVVETKEGKKITFIDTPGHSAFSNMRERGVKVADIIVLVISATDGVMPQTKEAIEYIKKSKTPFIVVASKVDIPSANIDLVREHLEKEGVSLEGAGGDTPFLSVSGRTGQGVEELLEMISLVSEINNIKGDPEEDFEGVIIETGKDNRGITISLVVRNGKLEIGNEVVSDGIKARIRGLFDYQNKSIKLAGPGEPVLVLGFSDTPGIGGYIRKVVNSDTLPEKILSESKVKTNFNQGKILIVLKSQTAGSLEAIRNNIPKEVSIISSGIGEVNETDIFLAKPSNALVFSFESKISPSVIKFAETEGVKIENFDIIYKLFERLEELLQKGIEEIVGKAQVVAIFPYENKKVAGCKVLQGKIVKSDNLVLERSGERIGQVKIVSIKKGKQDINETKQGEECGIFFSPQLDFKIGDVLLSVRK